MISREKGVGEGLVGFSNLIVAQRCQNFTAVQVKCGLLRVVTQLAKITTSPLTFSC